MFSSKYFATSTMLAGIALAGWSTAALAQTTAPEKMQTQALPLHPEHFEPSMALYMGMNRTRQLLLTGEGDLRVLPTARIILNGQLSGMGFGGFEKLDLPAETELFIRYDGETGALSEIWIVMEEDQ